MKYEREKRAWLIQRLHAPHKGTTPLEALSDAFAFGGGFKNGGLTDEAMALLRPIFSFDYMGSAEYEFGAVQKALYSMAQRAKGFEAYEIQIDMKDVAENWHRKSNLFRSEKEKIPPRATGKKTIYVLAHKDDKDFAEKTIRACAKGTQRLKEAAMLDYALDPVHSYDSRTKGWMELDTGFMFFTDKEMFDKMSKLLLEG